MWVVELVLGVFAVVDGIVIVGSRNIVVAVGSGSREGSMLVVDRLSIVCFVTLGLRRRRMVLYLWADWAGWGSG